MLNQDLDFEDDSNSFSMRSFSLETASTVTARSEGAEYLPEDWNSSPAKSSVDDHEMSKDDETLQLLHSVERRIRARDLSDINCEEYIAILDVVRYV